MIDLTFLATLLETTVRLATPIGFAALGGVLSERSGVYNIGLEGMILSGAFGAAAGAFLTGSALGGLAAGTAFGAAPGLTLALLSVTLRVNQLVAGIALNLLLLGLTAFLSRAVFGEGAGGTRVPGFGRLDLPVVSDLPLVGPALFGQDPLVPLLLILCAIAWVFLFRTGPGLDLRAVGENPRAADVAGVPVRRWRFAMVTASGALAALGGCHLVLSQVYSFSEGMSAGKGFIALAAIILGRWSPGGALLAALFFGLCDAAQLQLQFANPDVPYQAFLAVPYLASLAALVLLAGRARAPAAVGRPYDREAR